MATESAVSEQSNPQRTIAVLGGTGPHGRGLARRFALAGHLVCIGSRDSERAAEVATKLAARVPPAQGGELSGAANLAAVRRADIVLVASAWDGCDSLLQPLADELAGRTVISCVNPLGFDRLGAYRLPTESDSAAEHIAALLPDSKVVGAFHHLSAARLLDPKAGVMGEDILVCGDSYDAKTVVRQLCVGLTGRLGIDAGPLRLARYIEPFTAILISVNKRYSAQSGIALSNLTPTRTVESSQFIDQQH